jgi:thiol-disulfide isomerase/thioredoxin
MAAANKSVFTPFSVTILVFVVLAVLIAVFYAFFQPKEKFAQPKTQDTKPKVMLFYAIWCGHCESFLKSGKWEEYVKAHPDVVFSKHDYDKESKLGDKYDVNSFPTIIAEDSEGKIYKFAGDRMSDAHIKKFIEAVKAKKDLTPEDY